MTRRRDPDAVILVAEDGRMFKVDRDMVPTEKGWGGTFEIYGKKWSHSRERWAKEDNLYYCNHFEWIGIRP